VRIVEPILDAMGIPHHYIGEDRGPVRRCTAIEFRLAKSIAGASVASRRLSSPM